VPKPLDFDVLMDSFLDDKHRQNPTGKTAATYRTTIVELGEWLGNLAPEAVTFKRKGTRKPIVVEVGAIAETAEITTEHLRAHITYLQTRDQRPGGRGHSVVRAGRKLSPGSVNNKFRAIQSFMTWLYENGEFEDEHGRSVNPMAVLKAPDLVDDPIAVFSVDQLRALVDTCGKGKHRPFLDVRDEAILRLFFEAGSRRGEIATARLSGLNLPNRTLRVEGTATKTLIGRDVPFTKKTALILQRYLTVRARHPKASDHPDALWLAPKGALTPGGLYQMIRRRGEMADPPLAIHPHQLRHSFANIYLDNGGKEENLKRLGGWQSDRMVRRYARANADQRARAEHAELALGDLI
jgi:site-specific recombinase XerD